MKRGSRRRRESSDVRRYKALTAKDAVESQLRTPILRVIAYDECVLWSLEYNVAEHLFKHKLELVKDRIFFKYGCGNKYIDTDRLWRTCSGAANLIQQDMAWFEEQGIEVRVSFKVVK